MQAFLAGNTQITAASALVLSLGIAIQNFPEGAIISMPLRAEGESKGRAFLGGVLSGVVEPIGAVLTHSRGAAGDPGAAVSSELCSGRHALCGGGGADSRKCRRGGTPIIGTVFFAVGFSVMMALDVALG